ncbi:Methylglutaconyl-CoA hydratase [Archangium gephyra]|uniref:Methylglutaconyl-CoA hydratase n=1 Tax=Archangium gephyra TaxID=48 RepID=A0AAC8QDP2_9BACT|nr:Methylglutaconyl-CoA hydratase [Archangium gephyra]
MLRELMAALDRAEAEAAVRVVVLTGAGEKAFCAGGDLGQMGGEGGFLATHEGRRAYGRLLLRLQDVRKPTVARVNGHALAGGLGLVLACDLAVAAGHAELGTPEIDVGLFPMMMMALLQRHVGRKRALEMVLTGERMPAREALALGLLNRVVPAGELDTAVAALAGKLAGKSQAVLALGRRAFFTAEDMPLPAALEYLSSQLSLNVLAEDAAEGVTAFIEKRPPKWNDR